MADKDLQAEVPVAALVEDTEGSSTSAESARNRFADPIVESREPPRILGPHYAACPWCGNHAASSIMFTWWGGFLLTLMNNCVKCSNCFGHYNGKTGSKLVTAIAVGIGIRILVFVLLMSIAIFG